jgi:hypothetical protein
MRAKDIKPCPFCGMAFDSENGDSIHPSWIFHRECEHGGHFVSIKDSRPGDLQMWELNCATTGGGCGVRMSGFGKEDVIRKWNTRK